jgi:hypothetical protein
MRSNLKTFDTIRLYKSWTIFGDFYWFFHFLNLNSNLNLGGSYCWVPLPYPAVTAVTAVYRAAPSGKKTLLPTATATLRGVRTACSTPSAAPLSACLTTSALGRLTLSAWPRSGHASQPRHGYHAVRRPLVLGNKKKN